MIEFRRKEFAVPAGLLKTVGSAVAKDMAKTGGMMTMTATQLGTTGISLGVGAAQQKSANNFSAQMQKQSEKFQQQLAKNQAAIDQKNREAALKGQKMAAKATNNLASAVKVGGVNNSGGLPPSALPTTAQYSEIEEKSFAVPVNKNFLERAGNVTYNFARELNKNGALRKKVGHGLALGATMTAAGYLADKAIQADRKQITGGAVLPKPEISQEERDKKGKKTALKLGAAALTTAGLVYGAKTGKLGTGWKSVVNKSGAQWKTTGKQYKEGFIKGVRDNVAPTKDPTTGKRSWGGLIFTAAFPAFTIGSYALGERKQLKEQAKEQQQRQYSEEQPQKKRGSVLKKVAIAGATTAAAFAAGRRGAFGAKTGRYLNDIWMTKGHQVNKLSRGKYGNGMMKSGSELWDKFNKATIAKDTQRLEKIKATPTERHNLFDIFRNKKQIAERNTERTQKIQNRISQNTITGNQRLNDVQSGKVHTSFTKSALQSWPVRVITFQEGNAPEFYKNMAKKYKNTDTGKVAEFLTSGTGQTVGAGLAAGGGLLMMKPWEYGDKATRAALGAVDKDAFAYEKSNEQQV